MSQENVEIVRRVLAEFERGNFWVPEFFERDVRIRWLEVAEGETETVGLQDMGNAMKSWLATWDSLALVAEQVIDAGDQVVVVAAWRGRGKASGAETEWRYGAVYTLRDGGVASVIAYSDPNEAFKAAGVRETPAADSN
jgi:ketosteroid isomerase-like protein